MKKAIALLLICCMMMGMTVSATAEAAPAPTIEEILNEYHQKSFENAQENTSSANARSGGGKTLEEETVDALNNAGYEAYNVTAENYDALEESLQTDFAEMGLDPNGSYIIAISGEDNAPSNPNSRLMDPPSYDLVDPGTGGYSSFTYTYNGTTYTMRYVTVTPTLTENIHLRMLSEVNLMDDLSESQREDILNQTLSIVSLVPQFSVQATLLSLLINSFPNANATTPQSLIYQAGSVWTTTYTQVYDAHFKEWELSACVEYVTQQDFVFYTYFNPATKLYESTSSSGFVSTIYSAHYNDKEYMKQIAAIAFENNAYLLDIVEEVMYHFNDETVIIHQRWSEYLGYEPA